LPDVGGIVRSELGNNRRFGELPQCTFLPDFGERREGA